MPYRARTKGKDERMVGYVKHNFFARYPAFDSWAHMNQVAEQWLREVADQRVHGTVKEVVANRFEREKVALKRLPDMRFDTAYHETRIAAWDGYIEVRGTRYSVPGNLAGQRVRIRIGLDDVLTVYDVAGELPVAEHRLTAKHGEWVTVPNHHSDLWGKTMNDAIHVERRPLSVYDEVSA
jgi:hypothetical protein